MRTEPRVSVIVPVYNGESHVAEALRSVVRQQGPSLEVIAVDDGSTDGSADAIRSVPGVRYVLREHGGVATARNEGLRLAAGELIAFCDQDDRYAPGKLAAQYAFLEEHPNVACVMGRQQIFFDDGVGRPPWLHEDTVYGDPGGVLLLSGLFRRSVFKTVGGFDPAIRGSDDFDLLMRAKAVGLRLEVLDRVVIYRRIHAGNASHEPGLLQRGTLLAIRKHMLERRQGDQK